MSPDEVVESIPMPACVLRGGRIVAANARFSELQGRSRETLLASTNPFADFISREDADRLAERHRARMRGEPVPDDYDFIGQRADGTPLFGRARVGPFPLGGPGALLWLCTDEGEREHNRGLIRGFVDAAVAAQRETEVADLFRVVREKLAELGLSFTLLAVEPQGYRVVGVATGPFIQLVRNRWPTWIPPGSFPIGPPDGQQGLLIDDLPGMVAQAFDAARLPSKPAWARAVVAAIPVEGTTRYLLASSGEHLDSTAASAFGLFGKQVGAAIDNVQRLTQLRRTNRELRAVNEVAFASATLGSGRAMQAALEQLIDSLDLDSAALFRRVPAGELTLIGEQGFERGWAQGVAADRASPWGEAAASGQPVLFQLDEAGRVNAKGRRVGTPAGGLPRLGSPVTLQATEPPSCVALPLRVEGQVNGVLIAARQGRPLGDDDLRLLGTVAAQVAVALQNATLLEQAQRRVDELSLLLELGHAVVGALELSQVLEIAARVAARVLRCTCAFIFLPDAGGETLRIHAAHDPDRPSAVGRDLPSGGGSLTALAYLTQRPQWSSDAPMDARIYSEAARRMGCRSTLAVPLLSHDRSLGALALIERTERLFDAQDVRLATHAAQLISAALESAELFEHERRRGDEMTLLQDLSRATAGKLDQQELLETALGRLVPLLAADAVAVYLRDQGALLLAGSQGEPQGLPIKVAAELPDAGGRLAALEALARDGFRVHGRPLQRALALPLHTGGALLLGRTGDRDFSPDEVRLATGVCAQLSVALLSARLYEDLRGSYAQLAHAQAELIDRERMAALGELSASIAHEVRNPLGVIFNSMGSLRRILRPDGDAALLFGIVEEEADRLNRMVGDLLDYSRPIQPALQPVQLRALIEEAVISARQQTGPPAEAIESVVHVGRDVATVRADARLLRQALINLFLNAVQAMPKGGKLTISARRGGLKGLPAVDIAINDTGPGIPPEARARIWQPFFTTKATGTGLGLAVVKRIVDGHGGSIVLSRAEPGAEFRLYLPLEG